MSVLEIAFGCARFFGRGGCTSRPRGRCGKNCRMSLRAAVAITFPTTTRTGLLAGALLPSISANKYIQRTRRCPPNLGSCMDNVVEYSTSFDIEVQMPYITQCHSHRDFQEDIMKMQYVRQVEPDTVPS